MLVTTSLQYSSRVFRGSQSQQTSFLPLIEVVRGSFRIDAGEAEIGFYEDGLELEDILREQVLLALPMQRVCSETCKGFCPVCGKNRNETACDCEADGTRGRVSDRWDALRKLEI